jgi:hypothetical protein
VTWLHPSLLGAVVSASVGPLVEADTPAYWQQDVRYEVVARLDEATGVLSGRARIRYTNRSPDTLEDFYVHLYLNAFRPGSRWADRDSIEGARRFNDLGDPDYAYERIRRSSIDGVTVQPEFPYAPDSTIARFPLPTPLPPGDSLEVVIEWDARPSTVPRRQGREGRRFDFAQWYPRVVVYDRLGWQAHPLYPAGEFYGEFATYDVTLDLLEDQVVGATGVPVEGDPGWERRKADQRVTVDHQRDWYAEAAYRGAGCRTLAIDVGRKCVRFYAEDVHHFAMSLNPDYVYEEGRFNDVVVRVLYLPDDRAQWGNGVVVARTVEALRWLDELFGPFPWPQLTNVHRIEGGGTEFPMMVMNGGASLGLILHEVGHNYLMGILANNEWKEGFLDEGFSSFQTAWYFEERFPDFDGYSGLERFVLDQDLDGWSEPVSMVSEDYRDFATYGTMVYAKGQLFFHQLRYIVGDDVMRAILREYYARWKLKHVTESALLEVAETESGRDLRTFFSQWLHGTPVYDYAIGKVTRREAADGSWETSVEVRRLGDGMIPVEIGSAADGDLSVYARSSGRPEREVVRFRTAERPGRLMLDPRLRTHDWNYLNNRERRFLAFLNDAWRFDTYVHEPSHRDRLVSSIAPTAWYNEAGGLTVGTRVRSNYLGRYERHEMWLSRGLTGDDPTTERDDAWFDFRVRLSNPRWLRTPRSAQSLEAWVLEGRTGAEVAWEWERRTSFARPNVRRDRLTATWMVTRNMTFLDRAQWENGGTGEITHVAAWNRSTRNAQWRMKIAYGGGIAYAARDLGARFERRYDVEPFGRATGSAAVRWSTAGGAWILGARVFGGGYLGESVPLAQRAIPVDGADAYERFANPLIRSRGAAFVRPEFFYHAPGNGNLRGYTPGLGGRWLTSINLEVERVLRRSNRGPLRTASVVIFGDGALADSLAVPSTGGAAVTPLLDAGAGLRLGLRIGDVDVPLRVEFPFVVSRPQYAHNRRQGTETIEFRWLMSLERSF